MPRKREQLEAMRRSSREAIMQAALRLFAERGYHATTISAIAQEAGIAKGLVYNYFASKQELLEQVVLLGFREFESLMPALSAARHPRERLQRLFELAETLIREKTEFFRLYFMVLLQVNRDERLREVIHQYSQVLFDQTAAVLRGLGIATPETEARVLSALLDGIGLHYIVFAGQYPLDDVLRAARQHYLSAAEVKETGGTREAG